MAHQTDVHIVKQRFESESPGEKVKDPVCGMQIDRRGSKHVLFRPDETIYFCSRECAQRFMDPGFKKKVA